MSLSPVKSPKDNVCTPSTSIASIDGSTHKRTKIASSAHKHGILYDIGYDEFIHLMELKQELIQWYNSQLTNKKIIIKSTEQLASGYVFIELIHSNHPKTVDLTQVYLKPKSQFELLQNLKIISACFAKLGWKKIDPEKYSKKKEKDYLSLGQSLKKMLDSSKTKEEQLRRSMEASLNDWKYSEEISSNSIDPVEKLEKSQKILELQNIKRKLLTKISTILEKIQQPAKRPTDQQNITELRSQIKQILNS